MRLWIPSLIALSACSGEGAWEPVFFGNGVPFLEVHVDNQKTTCLVDTGASGTAVRSSLAAGDVVTLEFADRAATEAVSVSSANAALFDALSLSAETDVGCLMGMDIHRDYALTLDYLNERIRFSRPTRKAWEVDGMELGAPIVLDAHGPIPLVDATFGDAKALTVVDTGATQLHIEPAILDAQDPQPTLLATQVSTPDGFVLGWSGTLDTLTVAGAQYEDLPFTSFSSPQIASFAADGWEIEGILGAVWLDQFVVSFNMKQGEIVRRAFPGGRR